ncbi:MAG: YchF/TatD family DNA exonuclease [Magnetococcales bacterium]|nr:YchF/TatD family DNA exonuclease [Magnetococcales bacterium]
MIFADSHCHLLFPDFEDDREALLQRARAAGVRYMNIIGTRNREIPLLHALAESDPDLYCTVGIHPHYAAEEEVSLEALLEASHHHKVVAIGETGLDYHYDFCEKKAQQQAFRTQIQVALAAGMPLVIHTREAEEDTQKIMVEEGAHQCGGVLHCFTGSKEMAQWGIEHGFYISFSGILTFKNAEELRKVAASVPLDRTLIETDAPYLAPIPHRGERNEPAYVVQVAEILAEIHDCTVQEVAEATTANYGHLFGVAVQPEMVPDVGKLAYTLGNSLYLNITRGCTLKCQFCPKWTKPIVGKHDLTLERNPTAQELINAMGDVTGYDEVVFCGFGEPTLRWKVVMAVAKSAKEQGAKRIRLNTDGLANLVHKRDVTPEMAGVIDVVSISLNAQDEALYNRHCKPALSGSYEAMKGFAKKASVHVPEVVMSALDGLEGVDIEACRKIAEQEVGVHFRRRIYGRVG